MLEDTKDEGKADHLCCGMSLNDFVLLWMCFMSLIHWMNMLSTPIAMLWPDTFQEPNYIMWSIEVGFFIDILRKCIHKKPKSKAIDVYEVFV